MNDPRVSPAMQPGTPERIARRLLIAQLHEFWERLMESTCLSPVSYRVVEAQRIAWDSIPPL